MRFLTDENFNGDMLNGLRRAMPDIDMVRAQDIEVYQAADPELLEWAAETNRILLTHDVQTVPGFAYDRIRQGLFMPGVIIVASTTPIGVAIEDLSLMIGASTPDEFENQVKYVPIR